MNAKQCAKIIKIGLRKAGIDFVATLPDEKVVELIKTVKRDSAIIHIRLSREEEGVGICAGAYLTGKRCALIMPILDDWDVKRTLLQASKNYFSHAYPPSHRIPNSC